MLLQPQWIRVADLESPTEFFQTATHLGHKVVLRCQLC
jgi:hypothetical protein